MTVPAGALAGLRDGAGVALEVRAGRSLPIDRAGIRSEIGDGGPEQSVRSDHALRKAGTELDIHVCGDPAGEGLDPPAAVSTSTARQKHVAVGRDMNLVGHADQVD